MAKTASKNSPTQRGKTVFSQYNGKPVVRVALHKRMDGKLVSSSVVAYKESASAGRSDLFALDASGEIVNWSQVQPS